MHTIDGMLENLNVFLRHSKSLIKYIYYGHHSYLKMDHPYHQQKKHFNSQKENCEAPFPITSEYIIENGQKRMLFIESGGICVSKDYPCN